MESYKHLCAKQVLIEWLRPFESDVFDEYPICEDSRGVVVGLNPIWTEMGRPNFNGPERYECPPTYDECLLDGYKPLVIFDVASQHEGLLRYGFEIVHTHDVSARKLQRLDRILAHKHADILTVVVLDAERLLRRCSPPKEITDLNPLMVLGCPL